MAANARAHAHVELLRHQRLEPRTRVGQLHELLREEALYGSRDLWQKQKQWKLSLDEARSLDLRPQVAEAVRNPKP